jgi:hypothetical protein
MPAFLADYLNPRLAGHGTFAGKRRWSRGWVWDEDSDYRGDDSSDEYYSTENQVHNIGYTGKNVPRQDRPET